MNVLLEMYDVAASLIECGNYRSALDICNYCLTHVPKHKHSSIDTTVLKRALHCSERFPKRPCFSDEETGFVYRNPVQLTITELHQPHVDPEILLSSNLIFNIALCHHLIALDINSNQKHNIKRFKGALKLYELAFHMHSKKGVDEMSISFALSLVNNCAQIWEVLGNTSKAQRFYNHMLSSLMMMIDGGEAEKVDQLEGYLLNASRLILGQNVIAAAA